ncbi:MAG: polyprenol monophosphomannose synthase [Lachnospiraceae bacterium]|nr:polyprenol monophosphomannose synthase [Lachnospiraceae bacterium]
MKTISIVVPTFNEAENVGNLVNQIDYALKGIPYEIIFVDDSNDETPDKIRDIIDEMGDMIRLRHREGETGLATAVLEGFSLAEGDFIAVMDADLQHPPRILRSMYVALLRDAEVCIPSRFIPGGSDGGLGPYRKLVSGVARYIGKIFLPCLKKISDPTSGLFMFRREIIEGADLEPIGWKILVEVLAMGNYTRVIEIPYKFQARPAGESKLSSKVTLQYLEQIKGLMKRAPKHKNTKVVRWTPERLKAMETEMGYGI